MLQCLYRDSLKHVTKCLQLDDKDEKHKIPKDIEKEFPDLPPESAKVFKTDINYVEFQKLKKELMSQWHALRKAITAAIQKSTDCTPILQTIWRMKRNTKVKQQLPSIHLTEEQQKSSYHKQFQVLLAIEEVLKLDAKEELQAVDLKQKAKNKTSVTDSLQTQTMKGPISSQNQHDEHASDVTALQTSPDVETGDNKVNEDQSSDREKLIAQLDQLQRKNQILQEELNKYVEQSQISTTSKAVSDYDSLKQENESLTLRLSMVAGKKLRDNNPAIADLSDTMRPGKLSEMFREIYDNAWTDLLDNISDKSKTSETQAIRQILSSMKDIFHSSQFETENIFKRMLKLIGYHNEALRKQNSDGNDGHDVIVKSVKDLIKGTADYRCDSNLEITKELITVKSLMKNGGVHAETFITKCSRLCLFMSVQDPPVFLDFSFKSGDPFDANLLSHFTSSGETIEYLVWPVMYLNEHGAILSKGVAQGKTK